MGRGPSTHQSSMESQVRIKINMTQADIPSGLSKLFHIMEQSIAVTEQGKKDE
jgi:DNA-binding XRE family transcriptional regulator